MIIYHKCSKNSKTITASYIDYHQFTVKISGHLHMHIVHVQVPWNFYSKLVVVYLGYKNNKLAMALKA